MALRPREMKRLIAENEQLKTQIASDEENAELRKANEEGQKDFSKLQAENEALKKGASPITSSAYNAIIAENKALLKKNKAYKETVKEYKKTLKEFEKQNKELRKRLEGLLTESPSPESKQESEE